MLTRTWRVILTAACLLSLTVASFANATTLQSPEFSLRALDGPPVSSESLRGEVVVLAFGASWLPLTRNQMESLKKLADQYAGRGVAVYWVSTESDSAKSKNFADDNKTPVNSPLVGKVFKSEQGTSVQYPLSGDELYVRAVITSSKAPK